MRGWPERVTRLEIALLAIITAAGAFLRFHHLGSVSLWLDEILSYDVATTAAHQTWWRWIVSSFEPEHGPLFHAALLCGRVVHSPEVSVRLGAAMFGTMTIPIIWWAARACAGALAGVAAALVIAASPLNVYYSRDGRPYALVMLVAALILLALTRGWPARWVFVLDAIAAYTSAVSAPVIAASFMSAIAAAACSREEQRRRYLRAAAASICAAFVLPLLYRGGTSESQGYDVTIAFASVLQAFSVETIPTGDVVRVAYIVAALAVIGAMDLIRRDRVRAAVVLLMTFVPALAGGGVLLYLQHWYSVRYVCAALPGYIVLVGAGIAACASVIAAAVGRAAPRSAVATASVVAIGIALALVAKMLPAARWESYQKLDWRTIASTIWHHAQPGDLVIATNDWSAVSLGFYLKQLPPRVRMISTGESAGTIRALTAKTEPAWIVGAGYYRTSIFPGWLCRYPLMLASPLDAFGLHYSPGRNHFLRQRALPGERRALVVPLRHGFSLTFSADDDVFLGEGWAGRERIGGDDGRWVMGTEASVFLPIDTGRAHQIRFRAMPFDAAGLAPQIVRVMAGETPVAEITLSPGWRDYEVKLPVHASSLLRFHFARANAPASFDASSSDRRPLSALFTELSVDTSTGVPVGPFAFSIRVQELDRDGRHQDLNEPTLRRRRESQFSPGTYDRDALADLSGRCGFDPDDTVPRLIAGTLTIEDVADSILDRGGCLDDIAFVRNAYWSIIGRSVTEDDAMRIVKPWSTARSRRRLVQGLIESSEFRERMTGRRPHAE